MQQAIWDSILNGNFINAKIFAYSRRSHKPGRVDTPKALFVNTHVLANACSYFRSSRWPSYFFRGVLSLIIFTAFDLSDGIETGLTRELPPDIPAFTDIEEIDSDGDYDPVEGAPAGTKEPLEIPAQVLPERPVKAYLVKYTAYRTFVGGA
jgi:hypothetical protein